MAEHIATTNYSHECEGERHRSETSGSSRPAYQVITPYQAGGAWGLQGAQEADGQMRSIRDAADAYREEVAAWEARKLQGSTPSPFALLPQLYPQTIPLHTAPPPHPYTAVSLYRCIPIRYSYATKDPLSANLQPPGLFTLAPTTTATPPPPTRRNGQRCRPHDVAVRRPQASGTPAWCDASGGPYSEQARTSELTTPVPPPSPHPHPHPHPHPPSPSTSPPQPRPNLAPPGPHPHPNIDPDPHALAFSPSPSS